MSDGPTGPDEHSFEGVDVDRRTFVRLSAMTGATLALPGNASASVSSAAFDDEYEYVLNHTPADHRVPSLVQFSDEAGQEEMASVVDVETVDTTEPTVASHARLTAAEAQAVSELPTAETFTYAPGANPFWRLGYYPLGVFPESERCVDFIVYEEMIAGMQHLEEQHPERLDFYAIGKSPGYENRVSGRQDPKPVYVAELTNDIDDEESYREKEKVFCSLSLHGDERAGAEAGCRFVEDLLDGRERETERLLDDAVVILAFTNPDGWVARHPQYVGKFQRGNARVGDTNRQYPIVGWINPSRYPAEPRGSDAEDDQEGIDDDVPLAYLENVPDALAIVEHFRGYENLNYGADFHGASVFSDDFVFGLISQAQYDHREFHELYGLNKDIDDALTEEIQPLPYTSNEYDYATIWDLLGYTDSGIQGDWLAHPESLGGLGMTSMDFEMAHSNIVTSTYYDPNRNDKQVRGYKEGIRTLTEFAVRYSDTANTEDEFGADVETGGLETAVVTTDALTRSSDQLVYPSDEPADDGDATLVDPNTEVSQSAETLSLGGAGGATTVSVPTEAHTLTLSLEPDGPVAAELRSPDGETVRSRDVADGAAACGFDVEWVLREPEAGAWTLGVEARTATDEVGGESLTAESVEIRTTTVQTENGTLTPDPEAVLGYSQFDYKVSPMVFFDSDFFGDDELRALSEDTDFEDFTDAAVDTLSVADVVAGEHFGYDNLVVVHDDGLEDGDYVAAIDEYVDDGGNLVVTDGGVNLLGAMDSDLTSGIGANDTFEETYYVAHLGEKDADHPLVEDARPVQNQLWKVAGLGYSIGTEAPMTLVDEGAFEDAGGLAAGVQDEGVSAGSLLGDVDEDVTTRELVESDAGSVHFVGGAFPPASQENLHPFGLLDYSLSFLGYLMLTNALGYVQRRSVGDETVTFGGTATFGDGGGSGGGGDGAVSASGSRGAGGTIHVGGDVVHNEVSLEHDADEALAVRDVIPYEYDVAATGETVVDVEPRRDDGIKVVTVGPDAPAGETFAFDYLLEVPESVGTQRRSGTYDIGPAQVRDPESGAWVDAEGTVETHVVVALEPLQDT